MAVVIAMSSVSPGQAGVFIGADEDDVDRVVHPKGYTGVGGTVELGVCINPDAAGSPVVDNIDDLVIPTLNAIAAWNQLEPVARNILDGDASSVPSNKVDYESVLVHEIGHCIGLDHPNLNDFTAATSGANGVLEEGVGADGVKGSRDDLRGDDINLHWFFKGINDPFSTMATVDQFTYTRDVEELPSGHLFVTMGSEEVADLLGYPTSEAVMVQGTRTGLDHRGLSYDDVAMIEFAASGLDETAGTVDDHDLVLRFAGFMSDSAASCDLMINFEATGGIASCGWASSQIAGSHHRMSSIAIRFSNDINWHFGQELTSTEPAVWVTRTASRSSLEEPGGPVTFTVRVTNGPAVAVSLTSLVDDVDGDLHGLGDCSLPATLAPNGSYQCRYTRRVEGEAGDVETSTTVATATDPVGSNTVTGSGSVSVAITDSVPTISLTRTATPSNIPTPGREVTFSVGVTNLKSEPLPLASLVDDVHGDLDGQGTCALQTIAGNSTYQCSYDLFIGGVPGDIFTSTLTAVARDDENNSTSDEETTTVSVTAGAIEVTKTVTPTVVDEPSGDVTYTIEIRNTSDLAVEVTSIFDELFGELTGEGSCETGTLAAGEVSECTFGSVVSGNGGEVESSFVTVSIVDGNGNVDSANDSSTVSIIDLAPAFSIEKIASVNTIVEPSGSVNFTVKITNLSTEDLISNAVFDTEFGDLDGQGTCRAGRIIRVGLPYFCDFTATVAGNAGDTQASAVVVNMRDDDGNVVETSSAAAPISITNAAPEITVQANPLPTSVPEPGGLIDLTLRVENVGAESLELTSLVDGELGDLDGLGTCAVPQVILGNGVYICSLSITVTGNAGDPVLREVSAVSIDDEGGSDTASRTYAVTLLDVLPSMAGSVTASTDQVTQPGDDVTYTVRIDNTSVEPLTLASLVDDFDTTLDGRGSCSLPQIIGAGSSYECSFTAFVAASAGDEVTATVTAAAVDDEANPVSVTGAASVQVILPPDATDLSLSSIATPSPAISGEPLTFTVTVANLGPNVAEEVRLTVSLPENLNFVSAPGCDEGTPGELTCDLGTVDSDQAMDVEVGLLVDGSFSGALQVAASVTSTTPEAAPGDEETTVVINAVPGGSLIFADGFESGDTTGWSALGS